MNAFGDALHALADGGAWIGEVTDQHPAHLLVRPGFSREITERAPGDAARAAIVGPIERRAGQRIDQRQSRDRGGGEAAGDLGVRLGVGVVFVTRGGTLDIVPTLYRFDTIDQKAATGSWHWFFLIQGRGPPEHMIGCDPEFFLRHIFGTLLHNEDAIEPAAWNQYLRCFRNPETIRATCDEYRAGASIDLVQDRADVAQKVRLPMLVLWGMRSGQGSGYDVLKVWRTMPTTCAASALISGHFIPEEQPDRAYAALKEFFSV